MAENKTRRDFIITTAVATGSVAAAIVLQNDTSHADTPSEITAEVENIMDDAKLEQFKEEIRPVIDKILNNPDLATVLKKYGLENGVVEIPVALRLDKIQGTIASAGSDTATLLGDCCLYADTNTGSIRWLPC